MTESKRVAAKVGGGQGGVGNGDRVELPQEAKSYRVDVAQHHTGT